MKLRSRVPLVLCVLVFLAPFHRAAVREGLEDSAARRVAVERARAAVEEIFGSIRVHGANAEGMLVNAERLVAMGPDAIPFVIRELERPDQWTYPTAVYALGLARAPESIPAIRRSIASVDPETEGKFADARKTWAVYALAVAGGDDAVDLADREPPLVGWQEIYDGMRLPEVAGILTAPHSVPLLVAQLERYDSDEFDYRMLARTLWALGGVADPSAVPAILPFLEHDEAWVRAAAAEALGHFSEPSVVDPLLSAAGDPTGLVSFEAAHALEKIVPPGRARAVLARLETVTHTPTRVALYRTLARIGGDRMIEAFAGMWGRPDALDRVGVMDAVGILGDRRGLNLLRAGLRDPDVSVALRALSGLRRIGGEGAIDTILAQIVDPRWPVAQSAVEMLAQMGERRAAPRIADRLIRMELNEPMTDPGRRIRLIKMGDALVTLRYTAPLPDLRKALVIQTDPDVVSILGGVIESLNRIRELGDDVAKWSDAAGSGDPVVRRLAYARLGEIGSAEAVRTLLGLFGRSDPEDGIEIVRALAVARHPDASELVERLLLDPAFDPLERRPLRDMAAWAARCIGGERMQSALRRSAERREGRDVRVLVYLVLLSGEEAIPTLRKVRVPRLRYYEWKRGPEQELLDRMTRELAAGRSLTELDGPPESIEL